VRPVNDATLVQKLQSTDKFGSIESRPLVRELFVLLNVKHKVAAVQIFHDKEQVCLYKNTRHCHMHKLACTHTGSSTNGNHTSITHALETNAGVCFMQQVKIIGSVFGSECLADNTP